MEKIYKRINIIILLILLMVLFLSLTFLVDNVIEKKHIDKKINEFVSRGELIYQNDIYTYYKVSKKYDYEDTSNIINEYNDKTVGTVGDIYLSNRNPVNGFFITKWLSRLSYIGHGGVVFSEDGSKMLEIVGNKSRKENVVKIYENTWLDIDSPSYVMLRVKDIDNIDKENIINEGNKILGCRYNYSFIFSSKKRFYCTDLISYIYNCIDIKLNKDMFFTTGNDIIDNDNTYMIYYRQRYVKNGKVCYNIYYLSEE